MSSYLKIPSEYDICLSMTWYPGKPHRISGHVFEIIDYYMILSHTFNVCILFGDTFTTWSKLRDVILSKYELSENDMQCIERSTYMVDRPKYIKGSNILFVDGDLHRLKAQGTKLIFDNIFAFKCSKFDTLYNVPYDVHILQDDRIYKDCNPEDTELSINYKKKINFDILKKVTPDKPNVALLYATINCRNINRETLYDILNTMDFDEYLLVSEHPEQYIHEKITPVKPPVLDIFNKFSTYVYTPLQGRFDGSPRFPAECKYYGLETTYHNITDEYLKHDTGLYWRRYDIENNFDQLYLTTHDDIFNIIKDRI